ncbi:shikimate dehydrogenase (NADP(+)) [Anaerocolumna cellulosilytica]|uniref:Shikimate dehydrogenase (NADP(+)) n=1 Tax=Anaerocolumna cellulosilytica TaxID=433286 RepID=A0A6S6QWX7_9FIRM|nr:shikimate dehydrogenase [Anaerocolumna cellulosilytica]MBB5196623.1 shikimate dehydrogenase [Anaerocolumna cellulosilytica]BCJ95723.1 shikimate dehydrogenase (NADP(+)) [Anaerocolumna cellulosilytica]
MEYGLIGEKLGHSFSKPIHERLAEYEYEITPLTREAFKEFMNKRAFKGINVTIPYKSEVIPYLDEIDEKALKIGAVNTIVNRTGKLIGFNTDVLGFQYTLEYNRIEVDGKKVLVLGNGGASKAVIAALELGKAGEIIIVKHRKSDGVLTYEECKKIHSDAELIINTSPVGMYPNIGESPIDLSFYPNCTAVIDIIYNPLKTKLLQQAEELGKQAVNGMEMLIAQAKYAVEIFLNKEIPDAEITIIHKETLDNLV